MVFRFGRISFGAGPIALATFLVVLLTLGMRMEFREQHFQEVDSYTGYEIMRDPVTAALRYVAWSYAPQKWGGAAARQAAQDSASGRLIALLPDSVLRVLAQQPSFVGYYSKSHSGRVPDNPSSMRRFLLDTIAADPRFRGLPLHGFFRVGEILVASHLPEFLQRTAMVPLGSTYPPGVGLFYSFLYAAAPQYHAFMSLGLAVTLCIFALCAVWLYQTSRREAVGDFASALTTIFFLFSISLYSFSFHMGNIVWSIATIMLFYRVLSGSLSREQMLRRAGIAAGILVFWNYLIIIPYCAVLALAFIDDLRDLAGWRILLRRTLSLMWGQRLALMLMALCGVFFIQPGQGIRAPAHNPGEFLQYLYYGLLNFIAWWNAGGVVMQWLQLALLLILCGFGVAEVLHRYRRERSRLLTLPNAVIATWMVFILFDILGQLNFTPTRQVLFLAPAVFLVMAFGFDWLARQFNCNLKPMWCVAVVFLVAAVGGWAQQMRFREVVSMVSHITVPLDAKQLVIFDSGLDIGWQHGLDLIENPAELEKPGVYFYASEARPFSAFMAALKADDPALASRIVPLHEQPSHITNYRFTAYTPDFGDERFAFMRPNSAYAATFKVN